MGIPELYLSAPAIRLPTTVLTNEDVLGRVRERFRGTEGEWKSLSRLIRYVFRLCGTEVRYMEETAPKPVADHSVVAARELLSSYGVDPAELDLVVYGSIARDYYEPATATEVAGKLGAHGALSIDVAAACAGAMVSVQDVAARFAIDDTLRLALVCTSSITDRWLSYDLQTAEDVDLMAAGLTIGNAASAMLISRSPLRPGGRILAVHSQGLPAHHDLCRAPIDGVFRSQSSALFGLAEHTPPHIRQTLSRVGWSVEDVDLFVFHQPSNRVLREIASNLGARPEQMPQIHGIYGNTESSAVPLTFHHLLREGVIRPGMKLLFGTAAAGFVMSTAAVDWRG